MVIDNAYPFKELVVASCIILSTNLRNHLL